VGDLVVWNQELRGGYGTIWPVDGEITKIGKAKITIRVQKKDGTMKEIAVKPESLVPRPVKNALLEEQRGPAGGVTGFQDAQAETVPGDVQVYVEERQLRESALAVPHDVALPDDLIERYHLHHGEPCVKCSCELQRDLAGKWQCARCLSQKEYHLYEDQIDLLYPKKRRLELDS